MKLISLKNIQRREMLVDCDYIKDAKILFFYFFILIYSWHQTSTQEFTVLLNFPSPALSHGNDQHAHLLK